MLEVNKVYCGDNLGELSKFPDCFFDSCVTDPPYGISFMNKHWDYNLPSVELWKEVFRVLKHGAHILVACGTRTQHRMAVNIEDAGFEIRDVISWIYGSGFPKSLDISKAIDGKLGVERNVIGIVDGMGKQNPEWNGTAQGRADNSFKPQYEKTEATSNEAKQWEGYGTALKPATEFWTLARKPLSESTIAENVLKHGTGGINIDGCRIGTEERTYSGMSANMPDVGTFRDDNWQPKDIEVTVNGRFPANLILDEFMGGELDKQSGISQSKIGNPNRGTYNQAMFANSEFNKVGAEYDDLGGASRFFYCAKADNYERNKGLKGFEGKFMDEGREIGSAGGTNPRNRGAEKARNNHHPTVKPIDLMRYLVRLITPKNGIVLDPFNGSGTTGIAAKLELMKYVGIERDEEYCKISEARIAAWNPEKYKPQLLFDVPTEIKKPKPIEPTQAELFG